MPQIALGSVPTGSDYVRRPCPVCGASEAALVRELEDHQSSEVFNLEACRSCSALYINPVPPVELMGRYYEDFGGEMMHSGGSKLFDWLRQFLILRELHPLLSRLAPGATIVDVGAGDGQVAEILSQRGYKAIGCDTYPSESWPKPAIPYLQVDLNGSSAEAIRGDAVIMRHVLEHIHEPSTIFSSFRKAGIRYVFIVVPNASSPLVRVFGENWYYWDPPRHLTFFTPSSLSTLAKRCGYKEVAIGDHGIDEIVTSVYRRKMAHWARTRPSSQPVERPFWYDLLKPKGLPAALSSAVSFPLVNTVLCRCYELED